MSNKKKKVSYAWPVILSVFSIVLYYAFEFSDIYTKVLCLYIAATVLLPLTLTYSANLALSSIPKKKKGHTRSKKNMKPFIGD